jgi:hypothetical protein
MGLTWEELAARLHVDVTTVSWVLTPLVACLATSWFCWRKGDRTDRFVAATFSAFWIGTLISIWASAILLNDVRPPLFWRVIWDALTAAVFLGAAGLRRKPWYGVAAVAQGVQMAANTIDVTLHEPAGPLPWALFLLAEAMNPVMMGAMIGSALSAGAARGRLAQSSAEADISLAPEIGPSQRDFFDERL